MSHEAFTEIAKAKHEPNWYFVQDQKKGLSIDPHLVAGKTGEFST